MPYYTNKLENNKLGSYTNDAMIAAEMGYTIVVDDIKIGSDGFAYVAGFEPTEQTTGYAEMRAMEYPPIAEQLDMIYWDKVNNTNIWADTITAIKQKYPKE